MVVLITCRQIDRSTRVFLYRHPLTRLILYSLFHLADKQPPVIFPSIIFVKDSMPFFSFLLRRYKVRKKSIRVRFDAKVLFDAFEFLQGDTYLRANIVLEGSDRRDVKLFYMVGIASTRSLILNTRYRYLDAIERGATVF